MLAAVPPLLRRARGRSSGRRPRGRPQRRAGQERGGEEGSAAEAAFRPRPCFAEEQTHGMLMSPRVPHWSGGRPEEMHPLFPRRPGPAPAQRFPGQEGPPHGIPAGLAPQPMMGNGHDLLEFYDSWVTKMQVEAGDADHMDIEGNLYNYLALRRFGESSGLYRVKDAEKENPFLLTGLGIVTAIQLIGPFCVLLYTFPMAFSKVTLQWYLLGGRYLDILTTFSLTKIMQILMGCLFIILFCLNGLYVLESCMQTDKRIVHMCEVFHAAARRNPRIPPPDTCWLYIGAFVNCWCLVLCAVAMWPCFIISDQGPKDILFDAFALTFLYNLDDLAGEVGFLDDQWDAEMFGNIYGKLVDHAGMISEIRMKRELHFTADNIYVAGIGLTRTLLVVLPALYIATAVFVDFGEVPGDGA